MGRIKTTLIKRSGRKLLNFYKESFNEDFNQNKKSVSDKAEITSKKLRNAIAGYITRLTRREQQKTR